MPNVRFAVGIQRLIPFLGYHHVLMILIAIAIILLCKLNISIKHFPGPRTNNTRSATPGWLLVILASNSRHFPHQFLLR